MLQKIQKHAYSYPEKMNKTDRKSTRWTKVKKQLLQLTSTQTQQNQTSWFLTFIQPYNL